MSQSASSSELSPLKRAIVELRDLRARIAQLEGQSQQPIAIVGVGLRLPGGAHDEASFWQLLANGVDAVTEIPRERWDVDAYYDADPDVPGKMYTRHGAFLRDVDQFDASFFGVSPREAASMDPQQRLLQEVSWEALENAVIDPSSLAGTPTGVFIGYGNSDYWRMVYGDEVAIDAYSALGNSYSVAAGRLAYLFGLHGPCLTVDTACSASLVAIHLACQSLRIGECSMALAGGVNLILSPEANINFTKSRMLARDGRCKTFDAAADGYVRGEGCGVVVLKPLAAAQADGNRILAIIRGTAVNQDGRSGGLTAPNGPAQEVVIRAALKNAGVTPHEVSYLEAHGTGTSLGDPIEIRAANAVLGKGRSKDQPLAIGTIKTNMGHLEAAAGVAGLLKVVLSLQHKQIPPHLHLKERTPHFDWERASVVVPTSLMPWQTVNGRRIAGLSSFGFSGTNAHLILEEAPESTPETTAPDRPLHVLAMSAKDDDALKQLAADYGGVLSAEAIPLTADVCFSANAGRAHFPHRLAVIGATADAIRSELHQFVSGGRTARVVTGELFEAKRPPIAFLFTGQGSQYAGMARRLYETSPTFRRALDRCDAILKPLLSHPLLEVLFAPADGKTALDQTAFTQPALFAVEYALAELWRSWGINPDFVMGHSVGEYVAACIAGVFSLEDGLTLIAERARLMQALSVGGRMVAVFGSPDQVAPSVAAESGVSIAAINGPEAVVISGAGDAVERVLRQLAAAGIKSKELTVSHAFHSPLMEPMLGPFEAFASGITYVEPRIGLISNVTGTLGDSRVVGRAAYWRQHVREPVQFAKAVRTLDEQGVRHFLEIGPAPVLLGMARRCIADDGRQWLPSLRPGRDDWEQMLESLQLLYTTGCSPHWAGFDSDYPRRRVVLPTYPFQRRRYWIERQSRSGRAGEPDCEQTWRVATAAALRQSQSAPLGVTVSSYADKWAALEELTTAHAAHTLRAVGAFRKPGEAHDAASLIAQFGIPAMYQHLLQRWLDRLAAAGLLRAEHGRFVAENPLPEAALEPHVKRVDELLADDPHFLAYLRNCGDKVAAVIGGQESPLETLFPGGSSAIADRLYDSANPNRYVNAIAGAAIEAVSRSWSAARPLRLLEVGAGTGGTTSTLLPALDPERSVYLFTDLSDLFLGRARDRFCQFTFTRFGVFDLEKDLTPQGHAPHSFDVVVGANVVHAVRDLHGVLDRLRTLLVPGGFILLIEATQHHAWFDFTTGLIEGWQHFADDLRGDNPLLSPDKWKSALGEHGFVEVAAFPEDGSVAQVFGQHVILARTRSLVGSAAAVAVSPAALALEPSSANVRPEPPLGTETAEEFGRRLREALPDERVELMNDFVRAKVMEVLRLDTDRQPDHRARLMDLGLDSLMAIQLRDLIENGVGLGRTLPATLMFDYPTIEAITNFLLARLVAGTGNTVTVDGTTPLTPALAGSRVREIGALSDEEAEALLLKRLEPFS